MKLAVVDCSMHINELFHGVNAGYMWELYEQYEADPTSVSQSTRTLFENWAPSENGASVHGQEASAQVSFRADTRSADVANAAQKIRDFGHLGAKIDPLGTARTKNRVLDIDALLSGDFASLPSDIIGAPIAERTNNASQALAELKRVYMGSIGFDVAHIYDAKEREWLREAAESRRYHPDNMPVDERELLQLLTRTEGFEQFLHTTFQGKKRFSIEGLDVMVPLLEEILQRAAEQDIYDILIGMAHRGRLNVLAHTMQKPYAELLAEFKDAYVLHGDDYTGDVKYHYGYKRKIKGKVELTVAMADNPSHLELVNPVIEGMTRAAGSITDHRGQVKFDPLAVLPILIHGDAAFAGQGIVPETLNLSRLPGWRTGGTIHIIANNQIGFTTDNEESRSTLYASDLAKGFEIPIIHVNADDVLACIEVARFAMAYQTEFEKDFLIDLVGYRRYGHNEGDEPRMTQPIMYGQIDAHPTVRKRFADQLVERGVITLEEAEQMVSDHFAEMTEVLENLELKPVPPPEFKASVHEYRMWETQVPIETLQRYNEELLQLPDGFEVQRGLKRVLGRRAKVNDLHDESIDWGHAESLAFATILAEGTPIRITGEDVERGTFSHRHAVLRNMQDGSRYIPLQQFEDAKATFEARNSALSENAAVGFEYGYALEKPHSMVLWEGQFGDFVNGAQPIIDEYIVSGNAKWNHHAPLVLLLPHGYEGQGPDHSTARLERWLQMAADRNMRIVNPTTAAQYYHLLRRHKLHLEADPRPLIVMSPKSLLRHPLAKSSFDQLANGYFMPVIDDPTVGNRREQIKRLVLCSGKVYVDAMISDHRPEEPHVAFVRVEQLYRFPLEQIAEVMSLYPNLEEIVWMQEEPRNTGAWYYAKPLIDEVLNGLPLRYIGRPHRASPAEGSMSWHKVNQENIILQAYQ